MNRMEPASARLVFADPPYNIGKDYGGGFNDRRSPAEYLAWSRRWIGAAAGLLTPDGSLWLVVNREWSARLQLAMEDAGSTGDPSRRRPPWPVTSVVPSESLSSRRVRPARTGHRRWP
jgi:hypothetical protein